MDRVAVCEEQDFASGFLVAEMAGPVLPNPSRGKRVFFDERDLLVEVSEQFLGSVG